MIWGWRAHLPRHQLVIGAMRREPLLNAVLNHWDEMVAYAALCCLVMGFD